MTQKALASSTTNTAVAQEVTVTFLAAIPATNRRSFTNSAPRSTLSARWIEDVDGKLMMLWYAADRSITAAP